MTVSLGIGLDGSCLFVNIYPMKLKEVVNSYEAWSVGSGGNNFT